MMVKQSTAEMVMVWWKSILTNLANRGQMVSGNFYWNMIDFFPDNDQLFATENSACNPATHLGKQSEFWTGFISQSDFYH